MFTLLVKAKGFSRCEQTSFKFINLIYKQKNYLKFIYRKLGFHAELEYLAFYQHKCSVLWLLGLRPESPLYIVFYVKMSPIEGSWLKWNRSYFDGTLYWSWQPFPLISYKLHSRAKEGKRGRAKGKRTVKRMKIEAVIKKRRESRGGKERPC